MIENDNELKEDSIKEVNLEEDGLKETNSQVDTVQENIIEEEPSLDKKTEENKINMGKNTNILSSLLAVVIDEAVVLGVSSILLFLADFIMKFLGYYITGKVEMFVIILVVLNIIYTTVMETSKLSGTLGKVITSLKVSTIK